MTAAILGKLPDDQSFHSLEYESDEETEQHQDGESV